MTAYIKLNSTEGDPIEVQIETVNDAGWHTRVGFYDLDSGEPFGEIRVDSKAKAQEWRAAITAALDDLLPKIK